MKFKKAYGERERVSIDVSQGGMTEQHHKDACCIQNVLRTYDKTGLITHVNKAKADYGDFTQVNEYQESLNAVIRAQDAFDELPSNIRKRFENDPGEFLEFVTNPDNHEEMVELGLAKAIQEVQPTKVEVVNQPAVDDSAGA